MSFISRFQILTFLCLTIAGPLAAQTPALGMRKVTHPLVWKYQWKDGKRANTIGSFRLNDPLPTPLAVLPPGGYSPTDISHAYGYNLIPSPGDGTGITIAIIDAYGSPNIQADLDAFCTQFGIPSTTVKIYYPNGNPGVNVGWAQETTLDVEWAHALAPKATIALVAAKSALDSDLAVAINYATQTLGAQVVSMSFGGTEIGGEPAYWNSILNKNASYVASAGDSDSEVLWPAAQTNVMAVGGTSLMYDATSQTVISENVWNNVPAQSAGTGGGISTQQSRPLYQTNWNTNSMRGVPDVSAVADPYTGGYVYFTHPTTGIGGWMIFGGTSWSAPQWAALLACRASLGKAAISTINTRLYAQATSVGSTNYSNSFRDIKVGNNILNGVGFSASVGYDYCTGLGSPNANVIADPSATPAPTPVPTPTPSPTPAPTPPVLRQWGVTPGAIPAAATTPGVSAISLGAGNLVNSSALTTSGRVVVWGGGSCANVPSDALSGVSAISLGNTHMMALKNGGVIAWGDNTSGETDVPSYATNVVAISAGWWSCLALNKDGTVLAWGNKYVANSAVYHDAIRVIVSINAGAQLTKVVGIADGYNQGMVLLANGTVVAFGNSFMDPAKDASQDIPVGLNGVRAISEGRDFALALKQDGPVVAWGDNSLGQCKVPAGLKGVVAISAGGFHSLALKNDGTVVAWGDNSLGQGNVPIGLAVIKAIEAGRSHSMSSTQGLGDCDTSGGGSSTGGGGGGGGWGGGGPLPTPPPRNGPAPRGAPGGGTVTGSGGGSGSGGGVPNAPAPRSAPRSR